MKQFLSKIFFWDEPAKGVFFVLTMLLSLPWLVLTATSIGCWLIPRMDVVFAFTLASLLMLGILAFIRVLYLRCLFPKDAGAVKRNFSIFFVTAMVMCFYCFISGGIDELILIAIFLLACDWSILPGSHVKEWMAMFLLWLAGITGYCMIFAYSILPFYIVIGILSDGPESLVQYHDYSVLTLLRDWLHISGTGWSWLAILSFLCLLCVYLLQAKIIARTGKVSFRSLFGRRVQCLLGLCVLIYAVCFVLAWRAEARYHRTIGELETHFGRPLTFKELEKIYYDGSEPDTEYWKKLGTLSNSKIEDCKHYIFPNNSYNVFTPFSKNLFWSEWEDEAYKKWQDICLKQPDTDTMNALLDGIIPPAERKFRESHLLLCYLKFDDTEILQNCAYLLFGQLRFALEKKDLETAKRIFDRLDKIRSCEKRDSFGLGVTSESLYMSALLCFVEAGLADDAWLDSQLKRLERLEAELPMLEKRQIFGSAVLFVMTQHALVHCLDHKESKSFVNGAELSCLRWFFPQVWWPVASTNNDRTRLFLLDSCSQIAQADKYGRLFWHMDFAGTARYINKLIVMMRSTRILLEAEKVKRRTGSYPLTMDNLPLDPFTGKPLQYSVGPCEIDVEVIKKAKPQECDDEDKLDYACTCGCDTSNGCRCQGKSDQILVDITYEKRTVNAMQVFSPGPKAERAFDDIRFFIRIK